MWTQFKALTGRHLGVNRDGKWRLVVLIHQASFMTSVLSHFSLVLSRRSFEMQIAAEIGMEELRRVEFYSIEVHQ